MIELVYVSRAQKRFNNETLKEMLRLFRQRNQAAEITGLFLYDGYGTFIQALEGETNVVSALFNKICKDTRHSRINLLGKTDIDARSFPDWRMGFKNLDESPFFKPTSKIEGYSNFLQQSDGPEYLNKQAGLAMELLSYFKQNNKLNLDKE